MHNQIESSWQYIRISIKNCQEAKFDVYPYVFRSRMAIIASAAQLIVQSIPYSISLLSLFGALWDDPPRSATLFSPSVPPKRLFRSANTPERHTTVRRFVLFYLLLRLAPERLSLLRLISDILLSDSCMKRLSLSSKLCGTSCWLWRGWGVACWNWGCLRTGGRWF